MSYAAHLLRQLLHCLHNNTVSRKRRTREWSVARGNGFLTQEQPEATISEQSGSHILHVKPCYRDERRILSTAEWDTETKATAS